MCILCDWSLTFWWYVTQSPTNFTDWEYCCLPKKYYHYEKCINLITNLVVSGLYCGVPTSLFTVISAASPQSVLMNLSSKQCFLITNSLINTGMSSSLESLSLSILQWFWGEIYVKVFSFSFTLNVLSRFFFHFNTFWEIQMDSDICPHDVHLSSGGLTSSLVHDLLTGDLDHGPSYRGFGSVWSSLIIPGLWLNRWSGFGSLLLWLGYIFLWCTH